MTTKFSIILPTYKCKRIVNAVNSVINQSHQDWELLIIDNNRDNNVKNIINNFNDVRIRYFKIWNEGVIGKSRNLGIKKSRFSWISFLDSDDYWSKNKLEEVKKIISRNKYSIIYHNMYVANGIKYFFKYKLNDYKNINLDNKFEDLIVNGNDLIQSSVVVKKKILTSVNLYSENKKLISWEDFDLWLRIAKKTNKFYLINKCLGYYFIQQNKNLMLKRYINNIKEFRSKYVLDINRVKKKYKIRSLAWIDTADGLNLFKEKKYKLSLKKLTRIKKKNIGILIRINFLKIIDRLGFI